MRHDGAQAQVREQLLAEVVRFVRSVTELPDVRRIALLGSIVIDKPDPKDVDLLVILEDNADLAPLARCARQLQGHAQSLNRGADVFLADGRGHYLGRTCPWKNCGPQYRASCDALHCGRRPYLHDDLRTARLSAETIALPPVELWPSIERRGKIPEDVERILAQLEHGV